MNHYRNHVLQGKEMNNPPQELLDDLLPGEKAYPIFDLRVRWSQDRCEEDTDPSPWQVRGLPEGRLWNSICSWAKMPKDGDERSSAHEIRTDWWPKHKASAKYHDLHVADLRFSITFLRWEVWCIDWFQHWTWDVGLNDQQVLDSFGRYVDRTQLLNRREGKVVNGLWQEPHCLMGAEDRYRWCGSKTGAPDDQTDPPCRCPYCKEQGVVRIAH